ncbi:hypothetical protein DM02DRAFT_129692 [Periconia macrospinosa]|uniref:Uncharacterized protein n=1 Tax=Periconia macrospinosa TaxID=97972 RepID=A0A2V1DDW4_9PLEO|nr:hypothetical protein DM02DRAFT_129692 [Periconia macrospinosa]
MDRPPPRSGWAYDQGRQGRAGQGRASSTGQDRQGRTGPLRLGSKQTDARPSTMRSRCRTRASVCCSSRTYITYSTWYAASPVRASIVVAAFAAAALLHYPTYLHTYCTHTVCTPRQTPPPTLLASHSCAAVLPAKPPRLPI